MSQVRIFISSVQKEFPQIRKDLKAFLTGDAFLRRFVGEVDRLCGVMDAQLAARRHLAGDDYTIADIVTWPWASLLGRLIDEQAWTTFPHLKRWVDDVGERPAVRRGRDHHRAWRERELTEDEQQRRNALLFNQTNESVRAAREAAAKG